jgi:hypothetical protein
MRGGGGPHTRGKSTAPSRVERVAKYPIPGAEKPADLAHPPLSLKVVIVNLRRGSVKARDEFGELVIATTHAMSCIVAEGLRALCCTPPVPLRCNFTHRVPTSAAECPLASGLGQGTVRQGECTPRDSRAGHWQNMQDRCGHVRRDRLTFKLCQAEDGLEVFASPFCCCTATISQSYFAFS